MVGERQGESRMELGRLHCVARWSSMLGWKGRVGGVLKLSRSRRTERLLEPRPASIAAPKVSKSPSCALFASAL